MISKSSSFGRQVALLEVNHKDIGALMVKEGLAFSELKYGKDKYRAEEDEAKKAGRGIWTQPNGGERPWDFRAKRGNAKRGKTVSLLDMPMHPCNLGPRSDFLEPPRPVVIAQRSVAPMAVFNL